MRAELVAVIGAAATAKGLASDAVARGALTSFADMGAALIAAKVAATAARGVAHMVIGGRVEAIEAYATGLGLNSQDAELDNGMLTSSGEGIEEHFDSEAAEALTDDVYSLANAYASYSRLLRTVADAVTRYANELFYHRGQAQDAQERVIGAADRIDDIDVRWRDVIDDEADDAEGARVRDLINSNLSHIERELERVIDNCEELLSEEVSILSTLIQAGDRIVDTARQFDLAGGGRRQAGPVEAPTGGLPGSGPGQASPTGGLPSSGPGQASPTGGLPGSGPEQASPARGPAGPAHSPAGGGADAPTGGWAPDAPARGAADGPEGTTPGGADGPGGSEPPSGGHPSDGSGAAGPGKPSPDISDLEHPRDGGDLDARAQAAAERHGERSPDEVKATYWYVAGGGSSAGRGKSLPAPRP
jgi:hypothetical protein